MTGWRRSLLLIAGLLMAFAALVNVVMVVPHLQEDLTETQVRASLLSAVVLALRFGTFAMFAFAVIVLAVAFTSRHNDTFRVPLFLIAATYVGFGFLAFVVSHSPHTLGYILSGLLVGIAAMPVHSNRSPE